MTTKGAHFLALAEQAGRPEIHFQGNPATMALLSRAADEILDLIIPQLRQRVGAAAETRAADEAHRQPLNCTTAPPPWTAGDLAHVLKGEGWPPGTVHGERIEGEAAWRRVLAEADPATRLGIQHALGCGEGEDDECA